MGLQNLAFDGGQLLFGLLAPTFYRGRHLWFAHCPLHSMGRHLWFAHCLLLFEFSFLPFNYLCPHESHRSFTHTGMQT